MSRNQPTRASEGRRAAAIGLALTLILTVPTSAASSSATAAGTPLSRAALIQGDPGTPAAEEGPRVHAYEIDASFQPAEGSMAATAIVRFQASPEAESELVFYLHDELRVDSVVAGGQSLAFTSEGVDYYFSYTTLALRTAVSLPSDTAVEELSVFYHGAFSPSAARSPSDYMRIDADGVFLRSYAYSLWFPVFLEDRASSYQVSFPSVVLRTPEDFTSVFVGSRVREDAADGVRVSEWTAEYRRAYGPGSPDGQIHLMEMPQYGMIASGNVAGLPSDLWQEFQEQEGFKMGLAHELVHQFVFVPVEFEDPLWPLAIEGFPSYFYLPSLGRMNGEEYYQAAMARVEERYLGRRDEVGSEGSRLPPEVPLLEIPFQEMSRYKDTFLLNDRALLFLHDLRTRMGPEDFDAFTRDLFRRSRLSADIFKDIVEEHLPGSGERVRMWLETTEYPPELRL